MIFGDYLFYEFYGVIGMWLLFGIGKLYLDFSIEWNVKGYDRVSVSIFFMKKNFWFCKDYFSMYIKKEWFWLECLKLLGNWRVFVVSFMMVWDWLSGIIGM